MTSRDAAALEIGRHRERDGIGWGVSATTPRPQVLGPALPAPRLSHEGGMMTPNQQIQHELEIVRERQGYDVLRAEDVVDFARDPGTELHKHFEWDDTKAAQEYRLEQARGLIRICVRVVPNDETGKVTRSYVSLRRDRNNRSGGGYRRIEDVMANHEMREQLLAEALDVLHRWERTYQNLTELAPIFEASKRVRKARRTGKASKKAKGSRQPARV